VKRNLRCRDSLPLLKPLLSRGCPVPLPPTACQCLYYSIGYVTIEKSR
jgi:hypothetical protein